MDKTRKVIYKRRNTNLIQERKLRPAAQDEYFQVLPYTE